MNSSPKIDPVFLRVTTGALAATCEEMGELLVRASYSANIKERRDCSTGLFSSDGEMIMQAEHIPVHLGAMPSAVNAILGRKQTRDSCWILNDPYSGGTHLPDITVILPCFDTGGRHCGFAATRAHHADVGGPTPGSMPADSRTLADEGVVIKPTLVSASDSLLDTQLQDLIAEMRNPEQRLADLRAQIVACRLGERRLSEFIDRYGTDKFDAACTAVLDYAERQTRLAIAATPDSSHSATDVLEAGTPEHPHDLVLRLTATISKSTLTLDFTGTDAAHDGNLNCPLAVTLSACYFAVRVLFAPDAPACSGSYRAVEVIAPPGCLVNALPPAAVVAGNVETSSRIADLILAAFGRSQGQGTMNNLTLANDDFTYYETTAGGQGACANADGPTAVHVAMSNTLNTPVEALELEFPMRVHEYAVRRGSGGAGKFRGGDGVVREIEALVPLEYSLLSERRRRQPAGAAGGANGATGANSRDGESLPGHVRGTLAPGSRLRIETPGGGGFGEAESPAADKNL